MPDPWEMAAAAFEDKVLSEHLDIARIAKIIDPTTVQTTALDLIDKALEKTVDTPGGRQYIGLSVQEGKALALDTPIATPSGWSTMGELAVGDEVFDRHGRPCRVTWTSPTWTGRDCYAVQTGDGERIVADAAHEWVARLVYNGQERIHETTVLAKPRSQNAQIIAPAGLDLPDADLPLDPYVLGAWLGDGTSSAAAITCADPEILARIADAGFPATKSASKYGWSLAGDPATYVAGKGGKYRTSRLKALLRHLGVFENKHIPIDYLRASQKQRLALLQGLVDTDGYVMPKGQVEFCSTNKRIAEGVRDLVYTLGAKAVMGEGRATVNGKDCGPKYRVRFYLADAAHLFRKAQHCKDSSVARVRYVWAEACESVPTRCIEVDSPDHTFLAGRTLLPTHNSARVGIALPVALLRLRPDTRIVIASYGVDLARRNSEAVRNAIMTNPQLGLKIDPTTSAKGEWRLEGHKGGVKAAGVGSALTGRPADCVLGGTRIVTPSGYVEIKDLVRGERPVVLAFNDASGQAEWRRVIAARVVRPSADLVEVVTTGGRRITCTPDHRFAVGGEYREARLLQPGDPLTVGRFGDDADVRGLRQGSSRHPGRGLPGLLPGSEGEHLAHDSLHPLRDRVSVDAGRARQEDAARSDESVLHFDVRVGVASQGEPRPAVPSLREPHGLSGPAPEVLHPGVPDGGERAHTGPAGHPVPGVRSVLPAEISSNPVLRSRLCQLGALSAHDGRGQLALQRRHQLRGVVPADAPADHRAGRAEMPGLLRPVQSAPHADDDRRGRLGDPSPERGPGGQPAGESDPALPGLPHAAPQIEADTVSVVRRLHGRRDDVYDIQVEGLSNFFAEEVLVHNCLIIDDPHANMSEAESLAMQERAWSWWRTTAAARLGPGAPVIIISTRWSMGDLPGRLLAAEDGGRWGVLNIPAQADHDPEKGETDPLGREPGDFLVSARGRTTEEWEQIKVQVGSRVWQSMYQGRPAPAEGGMFKRDWWARYDYPLWITHPNNVNEVLGSGFTICQSWDLTFKDTKDSDFVVGQVWMRRGAHAFLLDQVRRRMSFTETRDAMVGLWAKWPQTGAIYVEDKANGPAVINALYGTVPGLIPVNPEGSKYARAAAVTPYVEAKNVFLPTPEIAPWVEDLIEELAAFPTGTHDDQVDGLSQALNRLLLDPWDTAGELVVPDIFDDAYDEYGHNSTISRY